jgi:hypothetical protein
MVEQRKEWIKQSIAGIITIIATLIVLSFTSDKDDKAAIHNQLQNLEINKVDKIEVYKYIDKQDENIKAELNSKLNIIINNQYEMNRLLREINKK